MARNFAHSPGRAFRIATHFSAVARFAVGAMAIVAMSAPVIMEHEATPPMRLVDDGGGSDDGTSDPPYDPSPSETSPSPSDGPSKSDGEDKKNNDPSPVDEAIAGLPVAAQAGISVGVIALATLALIPGRRPPADLRP